MPKGKAMRAGGMDPDSLLAGVLETRWGGDILARFAALTERP